MNERQPFDARSLDLGLRHLGWLTTTDHAATCAVCRSTIPAGAPAIATPSGALSHRACGELLRSGGNAQ